MKLREILALEQAKPVTYIILIKGTRTASAVPIELSDKLKNLEIDSFKFIKKGSFYILELHLSNIQEIYQGNSNGFSIGHNQLIGGKWIPIGQLTGLSDCEGIPLMTGDCVTLTGCSSHFAYVGFRMDGGFGLFFGSKFGSVGWDLDQDVIYARNIIKFC